MLSWHALLVLQQAVAAGPAPYWQQRVVYDIDARLDEATATLSGTQALRYVNRSPDTLRTISFHLYLNAFRPGSRWSDADSAEGRRRFNDLRDPAFGFNHVRDVRVDGVSVAPIWPFAPDSTVVRFVLPRALPPGDSVRVTMAWDARPSVPPRRQGRRGRAYDFAQWYPRVVVYDRHGWQEHPLYPAGEFYGEFGDYYVKLDVPADQVIGATGVPVCGDPGWDAANQRREQPVRRGRVQPPAERCRVPESPLEAVNGGGARKQVLWEARDVHHFAFSLSPDYRYEGGEWNGTLIHVLYQPGDEATWGNGLVVGRTVETLRWLAFIFGPYAWPQMTVVHRIEGGGTEFPMMQMNGSPSQGLNLHEGGHNYLMGILANNEWRETWLDESFTSFQTTWWGEVRAGHDGATRGLEAEILFQELDGRAEPISLVAERYRDFASYNEMQARGELFFHQLKRMVGDSVMLEILRRYYARWRLRHVDEAAFLAVAEEVSRRDLSAFFAQWLHGVRSVDYAVGRIARIPIGDRWRTTVEVRRKGSGTFPVTVAVLAAGDTAVAVADGDAERETLTLTTATKPRAVMLDPAVIAHDQDMLNNRKEFGWLGPRVAPLTRRYVDTWFSDQQLREGRAVGILPTLWYNGAGGTTIGARIRGNYLGRYDQRSVLLSWGTAAGASAPGIEMSWRNPMAWRAPGVAQDLSAFHVEGRVGAGISVLRERRPHADFGPTYRAGMALQWVATYDLDYLPAVWWDNGGTIETTVRGGVANRWHGWDVDVAAAVGAGIMYANPAPGIDTERRYDVQGFGRPEVTAMATRSLGSRTRLGIRFYGGAVLSAEPVLAQRRIFLAGADPYATLRNPFLRSTEAPLQQRDCWCRWQTPGGGNLRGYDDGISSNALLSLNGEVETTVRRWGWAPLHQMNLAVFGDLGWLAAERRLGPADLARSLPSVVGDAGVGVRFHHRIGATTFISRFDLPLMVSTPAHAIGHRGGVVGLDRLVISFSPVIP